MADNDYAVMGGGLKLKGAKIGKKKKKKDKKDKEKRLKAAEAAAAAEAAEADAAAAAAAEGEAGGAAAAGDAREDKGKDPLVPKYEDTRTPAQKKFDEVQKQREMEQIRKAASKTHKEKVDALNQHLATLSEHYDIPKVSWTK